MHELSIATAMVEMASEEAERRGGARVLAVHLRLGPLSGVVRDALLFSWEVACEDTSVAGARLEIDDMPVVVFCVPCGQDRTIDAFPEMICPVCDAPAPDVRGGAELEVVALEIQ
jgi:hydrogenase nickel incorporation protein HypA/HybF